MWGGGGALLLSLFLQKCVIGWVLKRVMETETDAPFVFHSLPFLLISISQKKNSDLLFTWQISTYTTEKLRPCSRNGMSSSNKHLYFKRRHLIIYNYYQISNRTLKNIAIELQKYLPILPSEFLPPVQNITNMIIVGNLNFWEVQNLYPLNFVPPKFLPPLKILQFRSFV